MLVVSYAGEFLFLSKDVFLEIINNQIPQDDAIRYDLIQKNILSETNVNISLNLVATKYRSRKVFLRDFTTLHMIELTKGCNCSCRYCQVSSLSQSDTRIHMSKKTAKKVVDIIFSSSSQSIKIEFQGGEPLINWDTLKYIVNYSLMLNKIYHKQVEFTVCTNLTLINDSILEFLSRRKIEVSTSLDGPKEIHDNNRPCRNGQSSYDLFIENLKQTRMKLGKESCSPLVTITKDSVYRLREIIDEYRSLGFKGIFLRPVNPYGNAKKDWGNLFCDVDEYLYYYKDAISYIINLNIDGEYFVENYTAILLCRILTPFSTGFVDLQSPSGVGISGVIYDINGDVFPSDEARMLARTGDYTFKLGNVHVNNYDEIFYGEKLQRLIKSSILEGLPGCSTCVYQSYCGVDPVRYYVESGKTNGYRPSSDFCRKNKGIFDFLFTLIASNNQDIINVFWSWITKRNINEVKL